MDETTLFAIASKFAHKGGLSKAEWRDFIDGTSEKITIPEGVTNIRSYLFDGLNDVEGTLEIPDSVVTIGNYAFRGMGRIDKLILGNSVSEIGNYAFSGMLGLSGSITFPAAITKIGTYAFRYANNVDKLIFLGTPNSISTNAFNAADNIADIYVPWEEDEVSGAPWGATYATIHYGGTLNENDQSVQI